MGSRAGLEMMKECRITYANLFTPLGTTIAENLDALRKGTSGVSFIEDSGFNGENWPLAKMIELPEQNRYEALLSLCLDDLAEKHGAILSDPRTLIILGTTKADIQALPNDTFASTFRLIREKLKPVNKPIVISNACISGVLAVNIAADYVQQDEADTVFVIGIDILSDFVVYGFQSLFALSDEPSRPFDAERKGINLGEACGTVIVSAGKPGNDQFYARFLGGSSSNDANHISGPSRTGEGLFRSVEKTLKTAGIDRQQIDYISAHGTATVFNDEMESIAFKRLELNQKPVNSMKGYFGHTLGAAGIIEIITSLFSMEHGELYPNLRFETQGTSESLNVQQAFEKRPVNTVLKTASGFGGGNASILLQKP